MIQQSSHWSVCAGIDSGRTPDKCWLGVAHGRGNGWHAGQPGQ